MKAPGGNRGIAWVWA